MLFGLINPGHIVNMRLFWNMVQQNVIRQVYTKYSVIK